jgi:hypothetical protein
MGTLLSLSKSVTVFWLGVSEWSLLVFGCILAWGLIGEYRIDHNPPPGLKRPSLKRKRAKKLFESLVIIGVMGELFADGGIFIFSNHLQTISDGEVAQLNKQSEEFRKEAEQFNKIAGESNERAAIAAKEAAQANERAAKFDADRVMVEKEAEEIRSTNFVLQAKVLELEAKIQPRTITPEQRIQLTNLLSSCPKGKVFVMASVLDAEATDFAKQIEDVLKNAGFEVVRPSSFSDPNSILATSQTGLHLVVKDMKNAPPYAAFIQRSFMNCGISMDGSWAGKADFASNRVEIAVGQHF